MDDRRPEVRRGPGRVRRPGSRRSACLAVISARAAPRTARARAATLTAPSPTAIADGLVVDPDAPRRPRADGRPRPPRGRGRRRLPGPPPGQPPARQPAEHPPRSSTGSSREDAAGRDRVTVLDVGSGSGDIPRLSASTRLAGHRARVLALDRDPTAVALGPPIGLDVVRGDALRLPFADASIDLVTAVKFAHHFSGRGLARLLAEMARVARRRVIVLDIRRHWLAYWGFVAWSRVFTRNRLVRHDGPLSVLRGFTPDELAALARTPGGLRLDRPPLLRASSSPWSVGEPDSRQAVTGG